MTKGVKKFRLRGGVDADDFPAHEISLRDVRAVARIAWEKWGISVADMPLRDLIGLAYAEGLYHGAMIGRKKMGLDTIGTTADLASPVAGCAASSRPTEIERPSVRDLLE